MVYHVVAQSLRLRRIKLAYFLKALLSLESTLMGLSKKTDACFFRSLSLRLHSNKVCSKHFKTSLVAHLLCIEQPHKRARKACLESASAHPIGTSWSSTIPSSIEFQNFLLQTSAYKDPLMTNEKRMVSSESHQLGWAHSQPCSKSPRPRCAAGFLEAGTWKACVGICICVDQP